MVLFLLFILFLFFIFIGLCGLRLLLVIIFLFLSACSDDDGAATTNNCHSHSNPFPRNLSTLIFSPGIRGICGFFYDLSGSAFLHIIFVCAGF